MIFFEKIKQIVKIAAHRFQRWGAFKNFVSSKSFFPFQTRRRLLIWLSFFTIQNFQVFLEEGGGDPQYQKCSPSNNLFQEENLQEYYGTLWHLQKAGNTLSWILNYILNLLLYLISIHITNLQGKCLLFFLCSYFFLLCNITITSLWFFKFFKSAHRIKNDFKVTLQ